MNRDALGDQPEDAADLGALAQVGRDEVAGEQHRRGRHEVGGRVDHQRDVDHHGAGRATAEQGRGLFGPWNHRRAEELRHRRQQREHHGGHRDHAVDGHIVQLVGHREPFARHDVHPHRLFGRVGEQPDRLDQELRDEQPGQRPAEHDRQVQQSGERVPDDRDLAAVDAVDDGSGDRSEQQVGRQPGEQHAGDRRALGERGRVAGEIGGQGGGGQQPHPVPEARHRDRAPETTERRDAQQDPDRVLRTRPHLILPGGAVLTASTGRSDS